MSRIKGKNTSIEKTVRSYLFSKGLRFRIHNKELPGKPDIFLKKYNTAIFVNGCYWHRHENCKEATIPKTNTKFWEEKFQKNIERDERNYRLLSELGVRVLVIWECEINDNRLEKVYSEILNNKDTPQHYL